MKFSYSSFWNTEILLSYLKYIYEPRNHIRENTDKKKVKKSQNCTYILILGCFTDVLLSCYHNKNEKYSDTSPVELTVSWE